jgi:hypothetical protein
MLFIEGELLHKLSRSFQEKNYIIQISNERFEYNKIQVALLSPIVFKYFFHNKAPFEIEIPSDFNLTDLVSCFKQLDSLFYSTTEITISIANVKLFAYLADFLDNRFLMKKCLKVNSNQAQNFKISSKQLISFPRSWLNRLIDFHIIINNKSIGINFSLFSCVCDKFQDLNHQDGKLAISISNPNFNCFLSLFNIMKGYSFRYEHFNFTDLKVLVDFFEITPFIQVICPKVPFPQTLEESIQFISLSYSEFLEAQFQQSLSIIIQNLSLISFDDLDKLPNSHLLKIFSTESLSIESEDYLFQLIIDLIEKDKSRILLLKTVHLEFVSSYLL